MTTTSHKPVRRRRVLLGTAVGLLAFAGIVGLAEGLRHPLPSAVATPEIQQPQSDPRIAPQCPVPEPREDRARDQGTALGPAGAPIEVTSNQLLDCPESYDRRTVRYQGEAVGGVLEREGGAWVQLNDDAYARTAGPLPAHRDYRGGNAGVGVFLPSGLSAAITTVGGPRTRGDVVEVVGVFRRVDPASGEVTVVRAQSLDVVRPGELLPDPPLRDRQVAAAVLVAVAVAMVGLQQGVARRRWGP